MPNHRTPLQKAELTGTRSKNKKRFDDRSEPIVQLGLGEPPDYFDKFKRVAWALFQKEVPWLKISDRAIVEAACQTRARLIKGDEVGTAALQSYHSMLSKMGATPADSSKVQHGLGDPGAGNNGEKTNTERTPGNYF